MSLKIIGISVSPYVRKVRVFCTEKNLPFEVEPLLPVNVSPEYKAKSPLGKIPCLEDDGRPIPDSSVICAYLEKKHPSPALYPSDAYDYARALWFEEYADTALLNAGIPVFQERVLAKRFFNREPDEAKVSEAIEKGLPEVCSYLEGQLGDSEYLVGNRFGLADIAIASPMVNFAHGGWAPDASRHPKLAAYVERIHSRPSFKQQIAEDGAMLG